MGTTLGVAGIGTGVTFGTAGMWGRAVACGFGVTGMVGATSVGCTGCAGLVGAGCSTDTETGRCLWHGCCSIWNSVGRFDTAFTQVSSHVAVDSTITGAYLVAVLG